MSSVSVALTEVTSDYTTTTTTYIYDVQVTADPAITIGANKSAVIQLAATVNGVATPLYGTVTAGETPITYNGTAQSAGTIVNTEVVTATAGIIYLVP